MQHVKMTSTSLISALLGAGLIFFSCVRAQQQLGQSPPFYNGSFRALGEIIRMRPSEDSAVKEIMFFEELYDSTNLRAALRIHSANKTFTYFQDIETRQTFLHTSSAHNATCDLIGTNPKDDIFGPLVTEDGWHYFYLRDLLTSKQWDTTPDEAHYPARNMSCNVWAINAEHSGKPLVIAMAVNSISWGSTTDTIQSPVSVRMRYANSEDEDETEINIFNFAALGDSIHDDLLQLPDGVFCGGYKKAVSLPPLRDLRIFNYRVEMTSSRNNATHYSDVWIDLDHMLYRIDYAPINDTFVRRRRALIVSGNEGAIYHIIQKSNTRCHVRSLLDLKFDVQMIADPSYIRHMTSATFFGGDDIDIKLTYKKQTVKRGIPCHMWEVLRTDWPPGSDGISTLWEWCFVVPKGQEGKRTSGDTYMVSLDLTVIRVSSDGENPLSLEEGTRFSYNLYDSFKNPPELIDLHGFDISPCYKGNDSVDAFLEVKLSASDYSTLSSSSTLNDPKFLSAWRKALDQASVLSDHSLRITRIKGYFSEDNTLFVTFVLLDRFPADAKVGIEDTQVSIEEMKENLNKSVSQGSLGITYKGVNLTASSWGNGLPLTSKPQPAPPLTTATPVTPPMTPRTITTPTEEVTTSGEEGTTSGEQGTTSGEQVTTPDEEVTTPGEQGTTSGEQVTTPDEEVTTPGEQVTTAASSSATSSASAPTTSWEIITDPVVTDDEPHDGDTTTSTYAIITELPVAYSTFATRYSPGVVGGTTAGLFLLGALIGASATYAKSAFFPTASLPTTVFH